MSKIENAIIPDFAFWVKRYTAAINNNDVAKILKFRMPLFLINMFTKHKIPLTSTNSAVPKKSTIAVVLICKPPFILAKHKDGNRMKMRSAILYFIVLYFFCA